MLKLFVSSGVCSLLAILAGCAAPSTRQHASSVSHDAHVSSVAAAKIPDLEAAEKLIIEQTNAFRTAHGTRSLQRDSVLQEAAARFAHFMAENNKYGHEADGREPAERVSAAGYNFCITAENIAYQFDTRGFTTEDLSTGLTVGWENSPPHRKNMLDQDVFDTAVAVAQSPATGYYYAVQLFGRPRSREIEFKIANRSGGDVRYAVGDQEFVLPSRYLRTHVRCRPAEVRLLANPTSTDAATEPGATTRPGDVIQPESGATYVIRRNPAGGIYVSRRS